MDKRPSKLPFAQLVYFVIFWALIEQRPSTLRENSESTDAKTNRALRSPFCSERWRVEGKVHRLLNFLKETGEL
jgi:hypothetical protein